ncbi:polyphosphate--glucose phosphotransferase [Aurantibacter crassamenti]|uniref:polyphosphate--glucose phosphotransferase n=1 Tax=Aurantibacter crassamenti TaxID=1837375 RepID=UPI001EEE2ED3|nr:ROK family protein [Aurantibacter crassamenti]
MKILGIDIGGSGIKGAVVDTVNGKLVTERIRFETPQPAHPEEVAKTVQQLVRQLNWQGVVGCSFPMVVVNDTCKTAGNMTNNWVDIEIAKLFQKKCVNTNFYIGNDADLAGLAEMKLGVGNGLKGKVIMVTIGTGLGTGVFYNGNLIPNIEMGRVLYKDGLPVEFFASGLARKKNNLKLKEWASRFDYFLTHVKRIMSPDYFIIGGGLSKKFNKFSKHLSIDTPTRVAHFENDAGIVGAALYAASCLGNEG